MLTNFILVLMQKCVLNVNMNFRKHVSLSTTFMFLIMFSEVSFWLHKTSCALENLRSVQNNFFKQKLNL